MAEFVEKNMQAMVGEVEEMERINLLSSEEIKKLIERRRNLEYKVFGMRKEKQNFVNSVMYDVQLLDLISVRRKKLMMFESFDYIERPIVARVKTRLRMMSRIWPSHADIWMLRISFAKSRKHYDEVSATYSEQIQFHGDNENVWIAWAQWEMEGRNNFENARSILLSRAPLYHPDSLCLAREYFRLELLYVEYLKKRSQSSNIEGLEEIVKENRDKVLQCAIAEKVYENSQSKFNCPDLYLEFYSVAKKFEFAADLKDKIIGDLLEHFPVDPAVWRLKAALVIEGHPLSAFKEEADTDSNKEKEIQDPLIKLEKLTELYERAMTSIGPSFLDYIIQDYFKVLEEVWSSENLFKFLLAKLISVFEDNDEHLSSFQFLLWFEVAVLMKKRKVDLKDIIRKAAVRHPNCSYIQLMFHQVTLPKLTIKEKRRLIDELSGVFGADICLALVGRSKPNIRSKLLERMFSHPDRELCKIVRLSYLQSLNDIEECRLHYSKYATVPPFNIEFHTAMLTKEMKLVEEKSMEAIRNVFKHAVDQFGSSEVGLWLTYVECEKRIGSRKKMLEVENKSTSILNSEYLPCLTDFKFAVEAQFGKAKKSSQTNEYFIDVTEELDASMPVFFKKSTIPNLFDSSLHIDSSQSKEKNDFFTRLATVEKKCKVTSSNEKENRYKLWEKLFSLICGETINFCLKKISVDSKGTTPCQMKDFVNQSESNFNNLIEKRDVKLSEGLQKQEIVLKGKSRKDEVETALSTSSVLKPEFQTQKQLIPYFKSRNAIKKERKVARSKTAGAGWFHMKAVESEEMKRDLKLLKMRSVMDPKRHYKRSDMKDTPKFFQMGKVVDSPVDFYSSRIPKKQRKATLSEEIINDEKVLQYQKRKYQEIFEKREAKKKRLRSVKGRKRNQKKVTSAD